MLGTPAAPTLETPRLTLRGWRAEDFEPYAAMLAEPEMVRFITRKGQPFSKREAWGEMAMLIGHWQILGPARVPRDRLPIYVFGSRLRQ